MRNFNYHIKEKLCKAMQGVGAFRKLNKILPRNPLNTIYESFVILDLDYSNVFYVQPNIESLCQLSMQYSNN